MQIVINDNGIITAYANVGRLKNGVDFFGSFPSDFTPNKYKWQTVEPEIGEDGEEIAYCCIIRKDIIKDTFTDENGEGYVTERVECISEYGEIVINPDYVPLSASPEPPSNAELAAAIAELAEVMYNG